MELEVWTDNSPVTIVTVGKGSPSLDVRTANLTDSSGVLQSFKLQPGQHTLFFQGRPTSYEPFGLRSLSMLYGGDVCMFLVNGKKRIGTKTGPQLCN
eukprot:TRINITY_DN13015_c0_g1_i2.p1 TRINITY_DN13015_c0_g1~~TRINITY_DN13015_c0_g1_i2.p1  ORF type:complete len:112 (-),score=8.66 TRINITY_DN13015_c0_g1_i2:402-692(-)